MIVLCLSASADLKHDILYLSLSTDLCVCNPIFKVGL